MKTNRRDFLKAAAAAGVGAVAAPNLLSQRRARSVVIIGAGLAGLAAAYKLKNAGCHFVICPDNTLHQALPYVESRSPLPWLHIAEAVMAEARKRGYERIGLSGTRWLMEGPVYPAALVRPDAAEREEMNSIIMDELVRGVFKPQAVAFFQRVYTRMKEVGCEAVVMGCTEIPLIMNDANSPLPTLDSTRLLARAALQRALR